MTTITREQLIKRAQARLELMQEAAREFSESPNAQMDLRLAEIALASLDGEPAGYHVIKECGRVGCSVATLEEAEKTRDFWNKKWTIRPYFYSAPPVQETGVYNDVLNIIGLLENNEWAEHCTSTVLGSLLESEITRLVGKGQPAPVVPDEITSTSAPEVFEIAAEAERLGLCGTYASYAVGWNACRAAMLNGDKS
ncbi:hypothetical protein FHK17_11080 [Salmonella enterica]|nr:hypothetical protein [Salmonella enterica]